MRGKAAQKQQTSARPPLAEEERRYVRQGDEPLDPLRPRLHADLRDRVGKSGRASGAARQGNGEKARRQSERRGAGPGRGRASRDTDGSASVSITVRSVSARVHV